MICVIILFILSFTGCYSSKKSDDVVQVFDEKSGNQILDVALLREISNASLNTLSNNNVADRSAPYVYRWADGRRESGDKVAVTPWDDYDFNGSKDYEYQLSYRGCRINRIEVRLLIPNNSGYSGYLDGGVQQTYVVLAIGAKAVDYFYYGVKIFVRC